MPRTQRSPEAQEYHRWYKLACWEARRRWQLAQNPLCEICAQRGMTVPANVADHVTPHKGNWMSFMQGDLQSLCASCHSGEKQAQERNGYSDTIGVDGFPIDPKHPFRTRN